MSPQPDLRFYQVSSKYSKGYSSYRADKKFYADADADANTIANWIRPKNNMSPPPHPPTPAPPTPLVVGDIIDVSVIFYVVHFASDLFKQVLSGPRLCIPDEEKKTKQELRQAGHYTPVASNKM